MGETLDQNVQIAILGAGLSSRLGYPKQLLLFRGEPLISRITREASCISNAKIFVVTGAYRDEVVKALEGQTYYEIWNKNFTLGIGASLRCLRDTLFRVGSSKNPLLIIACDQIFIDKSVIRDLLTRYWDDIYRRGLQKRFAVVCDYGATLGLPAVLSPSLWEDLGSLKDTEGAKKIWHSSDVHLGTISCPQAQWDIDTREDCKIHGIQHSFLGND